MNVTGMLAGGALIGFITASWGKIKAAFWRITSFFIQHIEFDNDGYNILICWMVKNYPRS